MVVTRVEYDAYRTDLELLQTGPRDLSSQNKIEESKRKFNAHKEKFEKLRSDVSIKLRFLDENKVRSLAIIIYCTTLSLLGDWLTTSLLVSLLTLSLLVTGLMCSCFLVSLASPCFSFLLLG